jgi:hypothetical protein
LLTRIAGDGQHFIVHADETLTAFLELESAIRACGQLSRQAGEISAKLPEYEKPIPQVLIHQAMARAYPIYEARAKVSEILRRVTAAASVTTFFLASLTTFLLASCGSNSSQPTYDAAIQEGQTAAQDLINQGASAVAIALVDDKRIIWSQRFGLADRDTGQMPTDSTMFGTGSVSKMFATIAVMKLVDRGVVDLDTPLVAYLPAFRMAAAGYENITVRMLLNHSSGFPGSDYRNAITRSPVPGCDGGGHHRPRELCRVACRGE